jgi:hypothetical protein
VGAKYKLIPYGDFLPEGFMATNYNEQTGKFDRADLAGSRNTYKHLRSVPGGSDPNGFDRPDDNIKEEVWNELVDCSFLDPSNIEVKVENGTVTLTGSVDSQLAKQNAEDRIKYFSGVKHINNDLQVGIGRGISPEPVF